MMNKPVRYGFLCGKWPTRAGCRCGMVVRIRVMPDCIVITPQNTRELWGCLEGLSITYINKSKVFDWLGMFPDALSDTGNLPVKICRKW